MDDESENMYPVGNRRDDKEGGTLAVSQHWNVCKDLFIHIALYTASNLILIKP
jgi:hypothetical protein